MLSGCKWKFSDKNTAHAGRVEVFRYDKLQNQYVTYNSFLALQKMNTDYQCITRDLVERVLQLGSVDDDRINLKLKNFYEDSTLVKLFTDVELKYTNMDDLNEGFAHAFCRLKKECPQMKVPLIYSQMSALHESVVADDSILGISLDKYMGADYPLYRKFFYDYQRRSMTRDRILPDAILFYLMDHFPQKHTKVKHTLLEVMLRVGIYNYVTADLLRYKNPTDVLGFDSHERKWHEENESIVWAYMHHHGQLQSKDSTVLKNYMMPAPYTVYFGKKSPMLLGQWIGLRIVEAYMKSHENITIATLLETKDLNRIAAEANYKP